MTPNEEKERKLFEQWVTENHTFSHIKTDEFLDWHEGIKNYVMPEASWAWAAWLGRAALRAESEPVLYMVRNLHNKSYATHPSKAECELYLSQSGLKNDGIEAEVIPLYTAPQTLPIVEREEP